jgi:hypothetical protein
VKQPVRVVAIPNIVQMMTDPRLFGLMYLGASWGPWQAILKSAFALPMSEEEIQFFEAVAGGRPRPTKRVRELVIAAGRRAGKDAITALIAAFFAMTFEPEGRVRAGERPLILLLAADRSQARNLLRYISGLFKIPALKALITRETQDGFELANGVDISVGTNDFRTVRGRAIVLCVMNELAFWTGENSASPDREVYRAILPATASLGDKAMVVMISSVHRRAGLLYEKHAKSFGKDDPKTLVITASTRQLNPTIDQELIDDALAADPQSAAAEYGSIWRDDLSGYISLTEVQACVDNRISERPPVPGIRYVGFIDASSGRSDSYTAAVASRDGDVGILHAVIEIPAPADPVKATATVAAVMRDYGINQVWGDRYAVGFVASELGRHGLTLQHTTKSRSDLYRELLPALRSQRVRLVDNERAVAQFAALERRALSAGGERIDHPATSGSKDDVSNAIAGALVTAAMPASSADNWIRYVKEEAIAAGIERDTVRPPAFGYSFDGSARIRIKVPGNATTFIGPTGDQVAIEEGRWANLLTDDVRMIIFSGLPQSLEWRELNPDLVDTMTPPPRVPIVRVADIPAARPIDPFDKAAIAADALAAWRRAR